ncbi:MAG: hypothetical protein MI863_08390 [Desulfobacterales bacterium]|nr:hypothetical protein [Desulfobacterales bacterium]
MQTLVLFVHYNAGTNGSLLMETIRSRFPSMETRVIQTHGDLEDWLLNKGTGLFDKRFIILFADTGERLNRLRDLTDLFEGEQLIILLPDQDKKTVERVNRFRPRYFSFSTGPYDDVCDVLTKMIRR